MVANARHPIQRYALSVAAVAAAVLLALLVRQWITLNPTPLILIAVVVAAWYGGRGPGLLACVLFDLAVDYYFETPAYQFTPGGAHFVRLVILSIIALLVSSRRRARDTLYEQREWLRTTLSSIGDAVIATDANGAIAFLNPVAESMTGWPEAEAVGRPLDEVFRIVNEETREGVESPVARVLREGVVVGMANHTILIARDGREVPIDDSGSPIRDKVGNTTGVVMVFQDVTERRRAEAALRNQRRWLQEVLNLAPTPILLVEPGTARVTFANRAADEIAGGEFPRDVAADRYRTAYVATDAAGDRIPDDRTPGVRLARGERLDGVEMDWETPAGKRSLLIFGDTLPEMHGHPATGMLVFHDVTKLKEVEDELRNASRLKDEFLATVSHELRTPLTPILGWVAMLRGSSFDDATFGRALDTIARNVRAQEQIVNDLLDVSRIISGKLRFEPRPVDVGPLVAAAVSAVQPAAEAKSIEIRSSLDSRGRLAFGDPDRLQQVVWNLLSNAVKFTPRGGTIDVRVAAENGSLRLAVADTGQGIGAEFLPHVFERFRQADGSITRPHGGLGLGLSIVRHLVEMHGGTVEAESAGEGRGATFTVTLPLVAEDQLAAAEPPGGRGASAAPAPFDCPPSLEGVRVLVVDDEPDTLVYLETALSQCRAVVTTAASAAEALAEIEKGGVDVLVSDIGMPGADGYELIRRVRAREAGGGGRLPAAALTAYARAEDRTRALAAGFQMHIPKPVEPNELAVVVAALAARSAGERSREEGRR